MKPALLITGASSVIGLAMLRRLAQDRRWDETRFLLTGRHQKKLELVSSQLRSEGIDAQVYPLDMLDESGCKAFLAELPALAPFLGVALLAGINHDDPITRISTENWDRVWQVNVGFHSQLLRRLHALKLFTSDARGFLTASQVAIRGNAGQSAYAAAKGALIDLMLSLPNTVRMNVLLPPLVPSPLLENLSPEARQNLFAQRLFQDPEPALSCAEAAAFLLSDHSRYVHRQIWHADSRVSILGWSL